MKNIEKDILQIIVPVSCQNLESYGVSCSVLGNKVILDFYDNIISQNSLIILEQKLNALLRVRYSNFLVKQIVFVGSNIERITNSDLTKARLDGIFIPVSKVKKIIAVCSGKGGVGKSTIASYIALKLSEMGFNIGILDADIYGSSIPTIFNAENKTMDLKDSLLQPVVTNYIKLASIGFLSDSKTPIIWRGPMLSKALHQLFRQTEWGELDYLIVDTPPGTGDVHISLMQNYPLNGIITVDTNDKLSADQAYKTSDLFRGFGIPILSHITNMSDSLVDGSDMVPFNILLKKFDFKNIAETYCLNAISNIMNIK